MKTKIIVIIVAVIIILIFTVNFLGISPFLNRPINYLVSGAPDKSCQTDSDCKIKPTQCGYCGDCGEAVNKNWQQYCPFKTHYFTILCEPCPPWQVKCVEGQCQTYFKKQIFDFDSCQAAGNPVMESYPRQCRSADGQLFVEVINDNLNFNVNNGTEPGCKNMCGDGVCAEIVCLAMGCPCAETVLSCPQDCQKDQQEQTGIISGKVSIGPICPVEREGVPCPVPAEAYTSRQVIVYDQTGTNVIQKMNFNPNGTFAFSLAPGIYVLDLAKSGLDRSPQLPQTVTVLANETVHVEFSIDTGIR